MKFTPIIHKATNVAAHAHEKHRRVGLDLPYIVHPYSVASLISEYTGDERVVAAGLLHDVIEDCSFYSYETIVSEFGKEIADMIMEVTEVKLDREGKVLEWGQRKQSYLDKITKASREALLISSADTLHNLESLILTYNCSGPEILNHFGSSIKNKLDFYHKLLDILKDRFPSPIVNRARDAYLELEKTVSPGVSPIFTHISHVEQVR